jgi:tetratricopeptide (TPR) repeat protein
MLIEASSVILLMLNMHLLSAFKHQRNAKHRWVPSGSPTREQQTQTHNAAARDILVKSVDAYPWNWSAWLELQALCMDIGTLNSLELKDHWMKDFFLASAYLELQKNNEGLQKYAKLQDVFPFSEYIIGQIALGLYNSREYDQAENLYSDMLRYDPYRVDGMDIFFSNILYVKESFASLSHSAHRVFSTDKYRPESCCVIGNYYSLKGQHEKAVLYFKRALKLNKNYLSAWTLMGHEYVEMKNTPSAIDTYRRAVDINPRDYRAWYGLGQTYEMLSLSVVRSLVLRDETVEHDNSIAKARTSTIPRSPYLGLTQSSPTQTPRSEHDRGSDRVQNWPNFTSIRTVLLQEGAVEELKAEPVDLVIGFTMPPHSTASQVLRLKHSTASIRLTPHASIRLTPPCTANEEANERLGFV